MRAARGAGLCIGFLLLACLPLAAQDKWSGSPPAGVSDGLESDFFGEGSGLAPEAAPPKIGEVYSEDLLKREPTRIGGSFEFKASAGAGWKRGFEDWDWDYFSRHATEASSLKLEGELFFSARPSDRVRYYGKTKVDYPFSSQAIGATEGNPPSFSGGSVKVPSLSVWELFTDVDIGGRVFVRAGKQMVKWGVGYFFQPADIISLTPVDLNDPTAEREGPVAVKMNVPLGMHNLDFYAIAPSSETLDSMRQVGLAARGELVLGGFELGLGAAYQEAQDFQFVATASGSIWKLAVFGEAAAKRRSLVPWIEGSGEVLARREGLFLDGTAGFSYSDTDNYWSLIAQYYYNGEGYPDARRLAPQAAVLIADPGSGIGVGDIAGFTGRHYLALNLSWSFRKDSDVQVSALLVANLSDGSGTVSPEIDFDLSDEIVLGLKASLNYGQDGSQFRGISGTFLGENLVLPLAAVEASLCIGTGKF